MTNSIEQVISILEKALETAQQHFQEREEEKIDVTHKAAKASSEYFKNLAERKSALDEQAANYQTELEAAEKRQSKLRARITDLSSRGDIDGAAVYDERLEETEKEIKTLKRKIGLVQATELKGDSAAYDKAKEANVEHSTAVQVCREDAYIIIDVLKKFDVFMKGIQDRYVLRGAYGNGNTGFDKVNEHFQKH